MITSMFSNPFYPRQTHYTDMPNPPNNPILRRIRSFVRREGRMTMSQQRAFDKYWQQYGLPAEGQLLNLDDIKTWPYFKDCFKSIQERQAKAVGI